MDRTWFSALVVCSIQDGLQHMCLLRMSQALQSGYILGHTGWPWKVAKTWDLNRSLRIYSERHPWYISHLTESHLPANLLTDCFSLNFLVRHISDQCQGLQWEQKQALAEGGKGVCEYFNSLLVRNGLLQFHTESIHVLLQYGRLFLL